MCGLHGLLPTSGKSLISIALFEMYLPEKMVVCLKRFLNLPNVSNYIV